MAFKDLNSSSPTVFLEQTKNWVDDGLNVDGIPFLHRVDWSFYQWEQVTLDGIMCIMLILILSKLYKNGKMGKGLINDVEILKKDHKFDRYGNKKLFKELR